MTELTDEKLLQKEIVPSYMTEVRRILRLFIPIFIGQLAQTSMSVVDTLMAGWAGTIDLSGVAIGGSFFWPALLFVVGLSYAIQPIVAQLRGGGKSNLIPQRIHIAATVVMTVSLIVACIVAYLPHIYNTVPDINQDMVRVATGYLYAVACGIPGFALFNIMRAYCEGLGNTMPTLIFGFVALCFNIPLNYIFIFGKFGLNAYGGIGCGIATSLTIYLTCAIMFIYIQRAKFCAKYRILRKFYTIKMQDITAFLRLSLPLGLSTTIEVACFSLVSFLLSPFGPAVVSSHTIALNVSGILFMIPLSLATCATIRVGEAMGAIHWNRALHTLKTIFGIGITFYLISFIIVIIFREQIIDLYNTHDADVNAIASVLLLMCCIYMLPDTIQVQSIGILRGFKDSRTIFITTVISYWFVAMPVGYILAYGLLTERQFQAMGFWIGFIAGLSTAATIYTIRLIVLFRKRKLPKGMHLKI